VNDLRVKGLNNSLNWPYKNCKESLLIPSDCEACALSKSSAAYSPYSRLLHTGKERSRISETFLI